MFLHILLMQLADNWLIQKNYWLQKNKKKTIGQINLKTSAWALGTCDEFLHYILMIFCLFVLTINQL